MKNGLKLFLGFIIVIALFIGLSYGFGWIGVHQTKTIGKAYENARREVFEQSQSYVKGMKQEALKCYKEWLSAKTEEEKKAIESIVSHSFAEFDENKLTGKVKNFVIKCKY